MRYTVFHTGYPIAGRLIQQHEWEVLSTHRTESAAQDYRDREVERYWTQYAKKFENS